MKVIQSILFCAILTMSFSINNSHAQAQTNSSLCQIHIGNLSNYVSEYNMFTQSARTHLRPFIIHHYAYKIEENLSAIPLFYTPLSDGSVLSVFQLTGSFGNLSIGSNDIVTQHIKQPSIGGYAEILGHCVNGTFIQMPKQHVTVTHKLPVNTQSALFEALSGVSNESIMRQFR